MIDLKEIQYQSPTQIKQLILSKITEEEIFRKFCPNYKIMGQKFHSSLYPDKNAGCMITRSAKGNWYYKDFGTGEFYGVFDYINRKYGINFIGALNKTIEAFKIDLKQVGGQTPQEEVISSLMTKIIPVMKAKEKTIIQPFIQPWTLIDAKYWNAYNISLDFLESRNTYSCKYVSISKGDKYYLLEYTKNNPIYCYRELFKGEESYKIYRPFAEKQYKWFYNGQWKILQRYDFLDWIGELCIITKSYKDCDTLAICGFNAVGLQGETNPLSKGNYKILTRRFEKIISLYDNDKQGIIGAEELKKEYGIQGFQMEEFKDPAEYCKNYGIEKTKEFINNKISQLI